MPKAIVAGVGMVKFAKPGQQPSFRVTAAESIRLAMADAGVTPEDVQQAYASFIFLGSGSGQHAVYDVFQTGIPIINLNNACAAGSTGLFLARQLIEAGALDCVLVVGFDEMQRGAIPTQFPFELVGKRVEAVLDRDGFAAGGDLSRWFGAAGRLYMQRYGVGREIFAKVAVKARRHAAANPYALFTAPISEEDVLNSPVIYDEYMTRLMACPPTCGSAAAVLVSDAFAKRRGISRGVEILGQSLATDTEASWQDAIGACGADNARRAAQSVYEQTGIGPEDVDVIELHDCFTTNEVISYEALGLCPEGGATALVEAGDNTYGGRYVINPSGGLMSKGHPIGATGVAQCCELTWQLRGDAGARQVPNARLALQHNIGLVAAATVTMYRLAQN